MRNVMFLSLPILQLHYCNLVVVNVVLYNFMSRWGKNTFKCVNVTVCTREGVEDTECNDSV